GNTLVRWNVRTTPRRAMSHGRRPLIGAPCQATRPRVGRRYPVIALKAVVFPAPLGPMRLVIVPRWTRNAIPASAITPRNSTGRSETPSIIGATSHFRQATLGSSRSPRRRYNRRHDPTRQKEHAQHQHDAIREHLPLPRDRLT